MRLAPKVFAASVLVVVILGGVASWSLLAVSRLVDANREIATRSVPALRLEGSLREAIHGLVRLEARSLVLKDRAYADLWRERAAEVEGDLDRLAALLSTDEELAGLSEAVVAFAAYRGHVEQERALLARGRVQAALVLAERQARPAADMIDAGLTRVGNATQAALDRSQARARGLEQQTWSAVIAALVTSLAAALGVSAVLAVRMTRSLRRLSAATRELAEGTFTEPLPVERRDEIGDLARSFNRMAERLREVDQLKEEFFSHISHDLRNPLASMRLAAQSLLERAQGSGDPRQSHLAELIDASVSRMLGMVNQILEFTRLRAHLLPLEYQVLDLGKLVARAVEELEPLAEEQGVSVRVTVSGQDLSLICDEDAMLRVVVNLLGNAIKFTPSGGSVTLGLSDLDDRLALRVEDTGIGIAPEALSRIFDPYRQAHGRRRGSGLGLAVVKGLVEAHGGSVCVESQSGRGSCFTVTVPRKGPTA